MPIPEQLVKSTKEAVEILAQDGREVRIGGGQHTPRDQFYHGEQLRRLRHVRESDGAGEGANLALMVGERVGVGEYDGYGAVSRME